MGRGLSPVQKEIMEHARTHGYITPAQAAELSWTDKTSGSRNAFAHVASTASRALRRLVSRGLLIHEPVCRSELHGNPGIRCGFKRQGAIYRCAGFYGPIPWVWSQQSNNAVLMKDARYALPEIDMEKFNAVMQAAQEPDKPEKAIGQAAS